MIGVICAGGKGTRLEEATKSINKHLIPLYNKPMIFYSISLLLLAKCERIYLVSSDDSLPSLKKLFRNKKIYKNIIFKAQKNTDGIIGAVKTAIYKEKIDEDIMVILGDNFFFGSQLTNVINSIKNRIITENKSLITGVHSGTPEKFGVIEKTKSKYKIYEKKNKPLSNFVVPGIYFYKKEHLKFLSTIKKSKRKEYEITDYNNILLKKGLVNIEFLSRGVMWMDCGSFDTIRDASEIIRISEKYSGLQIADLDDIYDKFYK